MKSGEKHKENRMSYIKEKVLHPLKMQWYNLQIAVGGAWRFFCKQQKILERKLQDDKYHEEASTSDTSIVFTCNGWSWSGGLADRIKGMVTVYDWCEQNNRKFQIDFREPFQLQHYLVPNEYNWLPQEIVYNKQCTLPRFCLMEPRTCHKKEVRNHQDELLKSWMDENLSDTQHQLHVYTNMYRPCVDFAKCFNKLFKPCARLQQEIERHLQNISGRYISISFRFTTLLGDFTDCTGASLPEDEQKDLIEKSLNVVHEIASHAPVHDKILITADSEKFLSRVKELKNVYVIPGKVGHIDYDHGDDVNMKTFLDFFMISRAEKVYLAKGPGMYNSAFAKTAAIVNNKPFEIYKY